MKRFGIILICIFLSLAIFLPVLAEEEKPKDSSKLAMDIVMVIDISNSMGDADLDGITKTPGNDPRGYRLDAAAMMLGMCETEFSRASVILFAGKPLSGEKWAQKLYPIRLNSYSSTRSDIITDIDKIYRYKSDGDTDLGGALLAAVELLINRESSENAPVVVLLTDGQISIQNKGVPDKKAEQESLNRFSNAVSLSKENGIRIYSIALKPNGQTFATDLLENAAEETGGVFNRVTKSEDLPEVFNSFFANQVGSEVVTLEGDVSESANGTATAVLSVPNKSVAEVNILIPVGKSYETILNSPSGQKNFDNTRYIKYTTQNCTFIKIIKPDEVGDWTISYRNTKGSTVASQDLRINVVFSYDVEADFIFDKQVAHKTDEQTVTVKFKTPEGTYADDTSLYMGKNNDGQTGIMVEGNIINEAGEIVSKAPISFAKTPEGFVCTGKINEMIPGVQQGDYRFSITLKGDGMDTEAVSQPFTVKNLAPALKTEGKAPEWSPVIHDPTTNQAAYEKEAENTINLDEYIADPDMEKVSYELSGVDDETVLSVELQGSSLIMKTKDLTGNTQVHILAKDGDQNGEFSFSIPVSVNNVRQHILENYKLEFTTEGNINEKHQQISVIGKLSDNVKDIQDPAILNVIAANTTGVVLEQKLGNMDPVQHPLQFEAIDGTISASFVTENLAGTYTISGDAFVLPDIQLQQVSFPAPITINNQGPKLRNGVASVISDSKTIHNLLEPSEETYLQKYINVFELRKYFEDPDGDPDTADHLTYQVKASDENGNDLSDTVTLSINEETDELSVETDRNGTVVLSVTATDADGDSANQEIRIEIDNQQNYIADHYTITVAREGEAGKLPEKNATYSYVAQLLKDGNVISDPAVLQYVDLSGLKVERFRGEISQSDQLTFENENDLWRASAKTYPQERAYQVTGEPLVRGVPVKLQAEEPFTLENHDPKPVKGENPAENMVINDVTLPEDAEKVPTVSLNLNSFFRDEDQEKLTFTATLGKGGDVVELKLSGDYVTVIPKGITGEASIHVLAKDESDGSAETDIPIRITNVETAIADDWKIGFEFVPTHGGDEAEVGDEVILRATIYTHDTPTLSGNVYDQVKTNLTLTRIESESGEETSEQIVFHVNGNVLETEPFTLSKQKAHYILSGETTINGVPMKLDAEKTDLPIGNVPPAVHPEAVLRIADSEEPTGYPTEFTVHPFLWGKKDESEFTIQFKDIFTDSQNDHLVFGAAFVPAPEKDTSEPDMATMIENARNGETGYQILDNINQETGELKLINDQAGERRLLLYATDSSKESSGIIYQFKVISQRQDILTLLGIILAGIVVLIILILFIYWTFHRKAWNTSFGVVNMSVNGTPKMTGIAFPKSGKKDAFLSSLRIKEAAAGDGNISRQLDTVGKKYKLRPKKNGVINIRQVDKCNSDFAVSVNGRNLTGSLKKADWNPNGTVKLSYTKPEMNIVIDLSRTNGANTPATAVKPASTGKPSLTGTPVSSGKPKL